MTRTGKRKIATIAFHRAINYGALLQVFALQKKIEELGGECTVLDYRSPPLEIENKKMVLSDCKYMKDYIRYIFFSKNNIAKYDELREFAKHYLNISKPYYNIKDLKKDAGNYDIFITGSDQVWNSNITDGDPAYFLDFVTDVRKKNAYAASFGFSDIPIELKTFYYGKLKNFKNISTREKQGAKIIKDLLSINTPVVLDPTLLVKKEEWYSLAEDYKSKKDYILIYAFGGSANIMEFAKNLAKKTNCKIVSIANPYFNKLGFYYEKKAGPERFLGLMKNARYVITNSFHGTVFSINFNKEVFVEMLPKEQNVNSRLENALDLFDLKDRQVLNTDVFIVNKKIDFSKVNRILEIERRRSMEFLEKIIYE